MRLRPLALVFLCIINFACNNDEDATDLKVKKITITGNDISDGATAVMVATVTPKNALNKEVTWSVSDETIAVISEAGVLTAKRNGTVVIKAIAKDGSGVEGMMQISISGKVDAIVISGSDITNGATTQLNVAVSPANAANKNVIWSVSDMAIATVSQSGLLTAISNGSITVTATAADGSGVMGTTVVSISSFTPLDRVDLLLNKSGNLAGSITIEIQNTNSETIATTVLPASNVKNGWNSFTFTPSVMLVAGLKYRIAVKRSADELPYISWRSSVSGNDLYTLGQSSVNINNSDFVFKTYSGNTIDQQQNVDDTGYSVYTSFIWQEFIPTKM